MVRGSNSWVENSVGGAIPSAGASVYPESRGRLIMGVAEKIRPTLAKMFKNVRDDDGILLQPAHIRAIALNMAQSIVKEYEMKPTP